MKEFKKIIISTFKKRGEAWLSNLDATICFLKDFWHLSNIHPVSNMSYHYVAKAIKENSTPVVLKIGCDPKLTQKELELLKIFNGRGAVQYLDYHPKYNALLLEQAIPGISLKNFYPNDIEYVIHSYVFVANHLHIDNHSNIKTQPISNWLKALDRCKSDQMPKEILQKAKSLRNKLLETQSNQVLLHGDLHLDNILKHENNWLAIDPQGVIGERAFEYAAFDFVDSKELRTITSEKFLKRIELLAKKAELSFERLKDWVFVRLVLSIAWSIEDKGDPAQGIFLAQLLDQF